MTFAIACVEFVIQSDARCKVALSHRKSTEASWILYLYGIRPFSTAAEKPICKIGDSDQEGTWDGH